jgi:hypothetical protein
MMSMAREQDPRKLFAGLQEEMRSTLAAGKSINHPGAKGNDSEMKWVEWLQQYLPKRYSASKAFVLDSRRGLSPEIDIVIYDRQYSPFLFFQKGACYVPAESVYAVLEIKQELNRRHINYAKQKVKSVRSLHRTSADIVHAGGRLDPRPPIPILSGILTYESGWADPLGVDLKRSLKSPDELERIDVGCSICNGSFEVAYDTAGNATLTIAERESGLIIFFLRMLSRLQKVGTVPAMDIDQYLRMIRP